MAKLRVGFGSDFNITGQKVGFGTTNPTALLEVAETAKADFNITGVTTLTSYGGFVAQNQRITEPTTIKRTTSKSGTLDSVNEREIEFTELGGVHHGDDQYFNTLSEDLVIEDGKILSIHNTEMYGNLSQEVGVSSTKTGKQDEHTHASHVSAGSLEQVSVTGHFSVPCGGINERQETPIEGTVRFNDDLNTLEFFNGVEWRQFTYNHRSGRGVLGGGRTPSDSAIIDYIQIMTTGNAVSFGDLLVARTDASCFSSEVRGLWAGGGDPGASTHIDYVTIASAGNGVDFGDTATTCRASGAACSSSTRGVYARGINSNTLQYVEIDTTGSSLDFGDLSANLNEGTGFGSPTRGIFLRGNGSYGFDAITIASKGNGIDFGEDCVSIQGGRLHTRGAGGCSNSIRGVVAGGGDGASAQAQTSKIRYLTISTGGTAVVFGDLTFQTRLAGSLANPTRGVFSGGLKDPSNIKTINYVTIASTGDAQDFGNLTEELHAHNGCSDSHGGLGGF